ncbi:DUF4142 domain-containing protein [Plastoroseomonas hellenica]|uniref:DUF4142 domain-containing protein n=1 Tax=Plastoroseomonas hellenica TaxID=2687306 RepID=UPI001BAC0308|nr:DUF4142 domain-containing protein [Plastoroseomonas hellenica]MBR0647134.1 DUF4142 domain-containing protein [Plastoroseomonas hellenica]
MMNRRLLSAGAAAAALSLARPAGAQSPAPPRAQTPAQAPAQPRAQSSAAPGSAREMALAGGAFSMQTSELAKTRATSPALKQFAELESEEQRAVMQALQLVGVPVPGSAQLPAEKAEMLRRLQAANGAEFDRMYLAGQVSGHQELLQLHTATAQNGQTPGERAISTVAVPSIRSHMAMLQGLQAQMRG